MSGFGGWAVEALVASTLLMLVVLLVRAPVRRAFGPDVAYALWALPALRLVLPPLPASWHAATVAPVLRAGEQVTVLFVEAAPEGVGPSLWSQIVPALALLWIAGALAFALWHGYAHYRFCARMLAGADDGEQIGGIRVIESAAASGPLAFGVWRRYIAFPRDVAERYEPEERDLALAHELGHHARGDLLANWVALAVLALHWFNPIAWRAFRAFRADQEIANDARVLAGLSPMRRHAYACAIVKTAHPAAFGRAVSTACHLHTIDDLKGRLRMLTTTRVSRLRRFAGTATATLLIAGGLGVTASGTAAAAAARDTVETATGVDLAALDQAMPAPPAPPADAADTVPPAPPAPPAADRKSPRVVRVIRTRTATEGGTSADGKKRETMFVIREGAPGAFEIKDIPEVSEGKCGLASGKANVTLIESAGSDKRRMIVCTDRIERISADGVAMAANGKDIERNAYTHALTGLRSARARMTDSTDMSADQRKAALDGIDEAIRELEEDLAKAD